MMTNRPGSMVQGKVTEIPSRVLTQCRQKTEHEVITLDEEEYQVSTVISIIKQTPIKSVVKEADSPTSTRDTVPRNSILPFTVTRETTETTQKTRF